MAQFNPTYSGMEETFKSAYASFQHGVDGLPGTPGQSASVTIGKTETLAPGEKATVTNVGTENEAIFNFGIPRGEDGKGGGVTDHAELTGRDKPDQHPMEAITGLDTALAGKQPMGDYPTKSEMTAADSATLTAAEAYTDAKTADGVTPEQLGEAIHTTMAIEISDDGFGGYDAYWRGEKATSDIINNWRNGDGVVMVFYDAPDGNTYTYWYSTRESDRRPAFVRSYIEDGIPKQVIIRIDNKGKATVERRPASIPANRNLLVNADFRYPVNPSGVTSWGEPVEYGIIPAWDKSGNLTLELTQDGMRMVKGSASYTPALVQSLNDEEKSILDGKEITVTVDSVEGGVETGTVKYKAANGTAYAVVDGVALVQISGKGSVWVMPKSTITIKRIYMELGTVSTMEKAPPMQQGEKELLALGYPQYTLPKASADTLGGIKASPAEAGDTQPVRIKPDGTLATAPGGGTPAEKWELIETINVTKLGPIMREAEPDGTPYKFKAMRLVVIMGDTDPNNYGGIRAEYNGVSFQVSSIPEDLKPGTKWVITFWQERGYWESGIFGNTVPGALVSQQNARGLIYAQDSSVEKYPHIAKLATSAWFSPNTTVQIWAVRA